MLLLGALSRAKWRVWVKFRTMPVFLKVFMLAMTVIWIWSVVEIKKEDRRNEQAHREQVRHSPHASNGGK